MILGPFSRFAAWGLFWFGLILSDGAFASLADGSWQTIAGSFNCSSVGGGGYVSNGTSQAARIPSPPHGCGGSTPSGWNVLDYCSTSSVSCGYEQLITKSGVPSCDAPNVMEGNNCIAPPPNPCPDKTGKAAIPPGQIGYGETTQGSNPLLGVICDSNQCLIKINAATTIPIGNGVTAAYISEATYTGQKDTSGTCPVVVYAPTPNDTSLPHPVDAVTPAANTASGVPASQADCPAGSAFGQVNGVNVCSPNGSQQSYVPESTITTNNGQTTTQTSQTTKTVNADGSVTSSTTVTGTGPDGATSSTTNTSNNGGNSGLGEVPGQNQGISGVDLGPAPLAESGDAPTISGLVPGTGADGAGAPARDFTVATTFTGSGACIADRSVSILGLTITVPLSQLCPYFDTIYKIVSVMAIFAALRILVM